MNWNRGNTPVQWDKLIKTSFGTAVTVLLLQLSLFMAELSEPIHEYSLLVLALSLLIAMFSIRSLWFWILSLNISGTLRFIIVVYVVSVLVMAIATTGENGFFRAVIRSSGQIPMIAIQKSYDVLLSILNYPSDFSHAYSGRNSATSANSLPANESITLNLNISSSAYNREVDIERGMSVEMNSQAKRSCQIDALSDETFFDSEAVVIAEGPRFEEGIVWWRLRNEMGSAWCPDNVLNHP